MSGVTPAGRVRPGAAHEAGQFRHLRVAEAPAEPPASEAASAAPPSRGSSSPSRIMWIRPVGCSAVTRWLPFQFGEDLVGAKAVRRGDRRSSCRCRAARPAACRGRPSAASRRSRFSTKPLQRADVGGLRGRASSSGSSVAGPVATDVPQVGDKRPHVLGGEVLQRILDHQGHSRPPRWRGCCAPSPARGPVALRSRLAAGCPVPRRSGPRSSRRSRRP